jgi:hypothetical protein
MLVAGFIIMAIAVGGSLKLRGLLGSNDAGYRTHR